MAKCFEIFQYESELDHVFKYIIEMHLLSIKLDYAFYSRFLNNLKEDCSININNNRYYFEKLC